MSLIDKIGSGVAEAGNSISQMTKEFTEQTRISGELTRYRSQREEYIKELGELVYAAAVENREADTEQLVQKIQETEGFVKNLLYNLNKIRGVAVCDGCGQEVPRDNMFCPNCGKKINVQEVLRCPKCGKALEAETKFCSGCGTKIG